MPQYIDTATARSAANTTSLTVTTPASVQAGDLLILVCIWLSSSAVINIPAGWTEAGTDARTGISTRLLWRTATASDAGATVTVTASNSNPSQVTMWVIRGAEALGTATATNQGSGSTTLTFPAYSPATNRVPLQIALLASSTNAAASITAYATGMTGVDAQLAASNQRTSAVLAAATDWSETITPGTTWTQGGTQFAVKYTVALTPAAAAEQPLPTPVVTLVSSTPVTGPGRADGTATISWPPVPGANSYDAYRSTTGPAGFALLASGVTSPYTVTGLPSGNFLLGVRAE